MNLGLKDTIFTKVSDIQIPAIYYQRLKTDVGRIDRAFGNGMLPGSIFTVTGNPGAGKTTYLLQVLEKLAKKGYKTAYTSGEECVEMLSVNCKRIGVKNINVANETHIKKLLDYTKEVDILIIDSFSSLTSDIKSSRQHERYCIQELCKAAKKNECVVGVVLHISKSGQYKGGTIIPHSVDTVIHLHRDMVEGQPDNYITCHVTKNRFGPTSETTLLMTSAGYDWNYNPQPVASNSQSVKPKNERKQGEMNEMLKHSRITLEQAAKKLNSVQRATYILRELVVLGKFNKTGRGQAAIYKKVATNKK